MNIIKNFIRRYKNGKHVIEFKAEVSKEQMLAVHEGEIELLIKQLIAERYVDEFFDEIANNLIDKEMLKKTLTNRILRGIRIKVDL